MRSLEDGIQELSIDNDKMRSQNEGNYSWKYEGEPLWEDITELVNHATEEMISGQLLHTESFTLTEGMSALEVCFQSFNQQ
jgi:hypothetical protein